MRHRPWTRDVNANFSSRACRPLFGLTFVLPTWRGHGRACGASFVEIHMPSPQMFNVVFSLRNCPRSTVPSMSTELHAATSSSPSTRKPSPPEQSIPTTRHDPHGTSHGSIRPVLSWRIEQATTTNRTSTDQTTDSVDDQIAADRLKLQRFLLLCHMCHEVFVSWTYHVYLYSRIDDCCCRAANSGIFNFVILCQTTYPVALAGATCRAAIPESEDLTGDKISLQYGCQRCRSFRTCAVGM